MFNELKFHFVLFENMHVCAQRTAVYVVYVAFSVYIERVIHLHTHLRSTAKRAVDW
jgi:hypothetical protein